MSTLEEIEEAVEKLRSDQLQQFRACFEAYDDAQIARDADGGRLDQLAEAALRAFRNGNATDL